MSHFLFRNRTESLALAVHRRTLIGSALALLALGGLLLVSLCLRH